MSRSSVIILLLLFFGISFSADFPWTTLTSSEPVEIGVRTWEIPQNIAPTSNQFIGTIVMKVETITGSLNCELSYYHSGESHILDDSEDTTKGNQDENHGFIGGLFSGGIYVFSVNSPASSIKLDCRGTTNSTMSISYIYYTCAEQGGCSQTLASCEVNKDCEKIEYKTTAVTECLYKGSGNAAYINSYICKNDKTCSSDSLSSSFSPDSGTTCTDSNDLIQYCYSSSPSAVYPEFGNLRLYYTSPYDVWNRTRTTNPGYVKEECPAQGSIKSGFNYLLNNIWDGNAKRIIYTMNWSSNLLIPSQTVCYYNLNDLNTLLCGNYTGCNLSLSTLPSSSSANWYSGIYSSQLQGRLFGIGNNELFYNAFCSPTQGWQIDSNFLVYSKDKTCDCSSDSSSCFKDKTCVSKDTNSNKDYCFSNIEVKYNPNTKNFNYTTSALVSSSVKIAINHSINSLIDSFSCDCEYNTCSLGSCVNLINFNNVNCSNNGWKAEPCNVSLKEINLYDNSGNKGNISIFSEGEGIFASAVLEFYPVVCGNINTTISFSDKISYSFGDSNCFFKGNKNPKYEEILPTDTNLGTETCWKTKLIQTDSSIFEWDKNNKYLKIDDTNAGWAGSNSGGTYVSVISSDSIINKGIKTNSGITSLSYSTKTDLSDYNLDGYFSFWMKKADTNIRFDRIELGTGEDPDAGTETGYVWKETILDSINTALENLKVNDYYQVILPLSEDYFYRKNLEDSDWYKEVDWFQITLSGVAPLEIDGLLIGPGKSNSQTLMYDYENSACSPAANKLIYTFVLPESGKYTAIIERSYGNTGGYPVTAKLGNDLKVFINDETEGSYISIFSSETEEKAYIPSLNLESGSNTISLKNINPNTRIKKVVLSKIDDYEFTCFIPYERYQNCNCDIHNDVIEVCSNTEWNSLEKNFFYDSYLSPLMYSGSNSWCETQGHYSSDSDCYVPCDKTNTLDECKCDFDLSSSVKMSLKNTNSIINENLIINTTYVNDEKWTKWIVGEHLTSYLNEEIPELNATITGLIPGKTYNFYAEVMGSDNDEDENISECMSFSLNGAEFFEKNFEDNGNENWHNISLGSSLVGNEFNISFKTPCRISNGSSRNIRKFIALLSDSNTKTPNSDTLLELGRRDFYINFSLKNNKQEVISKKSIVLDDSISEKIVFDNLNITYGLVGAEFPDKYEKEFFNITGKLYLEKSDGTKEEIEDYSNIKVFCDYVNSRTVKSVNLKFSNFNSVYGLFAVPSNYGLVKTERTPNCDTSTDDAVTVKYVSLVGFPSSASILGTGTNNQFFSNAIVDNSLLTSLIENFYYPHPKIAEVKNQEVSSTINFGYLSAGWHLITYDSVDACYNQDGLSYQVPELSINSNHRNSNIHTYYLDKSSNNYLSSESTSTYISKVNPDKTFSVYIPNSTKAIMGDISNYIACFAFYSASVGESLGVDEVHYKNGIYRWNTLNGGSTGQADTKKKGTYSISASGGKSIYLTADTNIFDMSKLNENYAFSFWIYLADSSIYISSIDIGQGTTEYKYTWSSILPASGVWQTGWNEVILYLKDAQITGHTGAPDLSRIKRINFYPSSSGTFYFDDLKLSKPKIITGFTETEYNPWKHLLTYDIDLEGAVYALSEEVVPIDVYVENNRPKYKDLFGWANMILDSNEPCWSPDITCTSGNYCLTDSVYLEKFYSPRITYSTAKLENSWKLESIETTTLWEPNAVQDSIYRLEGGSSILFKAPASDNILSTFSGTIDASKLNIDISTKKAKGTLSFYVFLTDANNYLTEIELSNAKIKWTGSQIKSESFWNFGWNKVVLDFETAVYTPPLKINWNNIQPLTIKVKSNDINDLFYFDDFKLSPKGLIKQSEDCSKETTEDNMWCLDTNDFLRSFGDDNGINDLWITLYGLDTNFAYKIYANLKREDGTAEIKFKINDVEYPAITPDTDFSEKEIGSVSGVSSVQIAGKILSSSDTKGNILWKEIIAVPELSIDSNYCISNAKNWLESCIYDYDCLAKTIKNTTDEFIGSFKSSCVNEKCVPAGFYLGSELNIGIDDDSSLWIVFNSNSLSCSAENIKSGSCAIQFNAVSDENRNLIKLDNSRTNIFKTEESVLVGLFFWMYVERGVGCAVPFPLEFQMGSSLENYYKWIISEPSSYSSWTKIELPLLSADTIGSPVLTNGIKWILIKSKQEVNCQNNYILLDDFNITFDTNLKKERYCSLNSTDYFKEILTANSTEIISAVYTKQNIDCGTNAYFDNNTGVCYLNRTCSGTVTDNNDGRCQIFRQCRAGEIVSCTGFYPNCYAKISYDDGDSCEDSNIDSNSCTLGFGGCTGWNCKESFQVNTTCSSDYFWNNQRKRCEKSLSFITKEPCFPDII